MGRRKKQASTVMAIRISDPNVAAYLATFDGKGRAEAIRQALGEWFDRTLEGSERKERALRRESDKLKDEADLLNLANIRERKRRAEFAGQLEAETTKRQQAVLDLLEARRKDGKPVGPGWLDSPAGMKALEGVGSSLEEAMELAKRGVP